MNITDAINAIIDNDDALNFALRDLLMHDAMPTPELIDANDLLNFDDRYRSRELLIERIDIIRALLEHADRETLTAMRLADSLCPLHACDYAICFDDDDAECAAIRAIHPSHDT